MDKRITISDIAREAGVTKSTVSFVLNDRNGRIPISAATREKVLKVVERYHYQPNQMARSLTTRRTGNLGFILSDNMAGGFANVFFATCLNGAEAECRRRGYGLTVGLFNLSCIDSFIFPTPVRQHCVDGIILAGFVADEVLDRICASKIPCVCIGDYMTHPERVTTVSNAITRSTVSLLSYLHRRGHERIAIHYPTTPRDLREVELVKAALAETPELARCRPRFMLTPEHNGDYAAAGRLLQDLLALPEAERPTALIGNDQTTLALEHELRRHGLRCPEDLALVSTTDTSLCEFASPALTAQRYDLAALGAHAVTLLIDHIVNGVPLTSEQSKNDFPGTLVERDSV